MVDFKTHPVTKEQAEQIRLWRVNASCTWVEISIMAISNWSDLDIKSDERYGNDPFYQGQSLCSEAAQFFGENAGEEPWN